MDHFYIPSKEDLLDRDLEPFQKYFPSRTSVALQCQNEAKTAKKLSMQSITSSICIPEYKICLDKDFLEDDIKHFQSFFQHELCANSPSAGTENSEEVSDITSKVVVNNNPTAGEDPSKSDVFETCSSEFEIHCDDDASLQSRNTVCNQSATSDDPFSDAQNRPELLVLPEAAAKKSFDISDKELIQCAQNIAVYLEHVNAITNYQVNLLSVKRKLS